MLIVQILLALILLLPLVLGGVVWFFFNNLVAKKNQVDQAFSSVDVLLKKRCDVIPSLVSIAKTYMEFEERTLVKVTQLRSQVMKGQGSTEDRVQLENQLSGALANVLALTENYPDLKTDGQFVQLQGSLNEVEEQLSAARRFYNRAVTDYNNSIEMFPSNLIATWRRDEAKSLFEATAQDRRAIDVRNLLQN
ncbi:LemA family protein [Acaryochloris sp. 'Moss Beach']|uniref:LemA family protein n=1 Tax=Acaryochloris sp. 'Moss Beach' TaxID=2740837 RepID=UPI001F32208C|nr:LemA family protein [Acaryochloris sp. 'Moss Beach']UJB69377.1 LemA family protein [Acaryochloris sp. 'Moss Beach']